MCCTEDDDDEVEEDPQSFPVKGPILHRRCTDFCWLLIFSAYCLVYLACSIIVYTSSNTDQLWHGLDHKGNFCGRGDQEENPKVYFPRLHLDLLEDPTLMTTYGVCVKKCPGKGTTIDDEGRKWYVPLPTLDLANRCIPFEHVDVINGTAMCASPACNPPRRGKEPASPDEICGLMEDNSAGYWVLGEPDHWLLWGWRAEGLTQSDIDQRIAILRANVEARKACEVVVERDVSFRLEQRDAGLSFKLISHFTGLVFRQAQQLYEDLPTITVLGLFGSLVLSMLLIMVFPCCMKLMLWGFIVAVMVVLVVVDYILFVQANLIDDRIGPALADVLKMAGLADAKMESRMHSLGISTDLATDKLGLPGDARSQTIYMWLAIGLAILIAVLLCILVALRKNFVLLLALYSCASRTLREMPSLILLPFGVLISLAVSTMALLHTVLGTLTLEREVTLKWVEKLGVEVSEYNRTFESVQKLLMWVTVFSFLWVYFFHMAIFQITLAGAISNWYFFRNDREHNAGTGRFSSGWFFGRPLLYALARVLRYHLGSAALGSFVLALAAVPRIVLEYIDREMKHTDDSNMVLKMVVPCTRCCLACFERCLKWLTEYAYINVAVTGKNFCKSARSSMVLLLNHPAQVMLDRIASASLTVGACLLVPLCMVIAAYFVVDSWLLCGSFVFFLAMMVTRVVVGVYDICISSLLVCAMDDKENYGGKYAPTAIREAMGLPEPPERERSSSVEVELQERS